jgi:hypothetical protein
MQHDALSSLIAQVTDVIKGYLCRCLASRMQFLHRERRFLRGGLKVAWLRVNSWLRFLLVLFSIASQIVVSEARYERGLP